MSPGEINCAIAVFGGGPAGLSAAMLLKEAGVRDVIVFEASPRVGGKCLTLERDGALHELGTCYSTLDHSLTNQWMADLGIAQARLGAQLFDGKPFMRYVGGGLGSADLMRYLALWARHSPAIAAGEADAGRRAEWAMPARAWLQHHRLGATERFMHRAVTTLGYGLLDDVPMCQALRWCTPNLFLTGLLNEVRMPVTGWQDFWDRLAAKLDVRREEPVIGIERENDGGLLKTPKGSYRYRHLIVAAPLDCFVATTRLSEMEARIAGAIDWGTYSITLVRIEDWYKDHFVEAYSAGAAPGAYGRLLGSRRALPAMTRADAAAASDIYLCAQQYGAGAPRPDLDKLLFEEIAHLGGRPKDILIRQDWRYFPRYRPAAIEAGLLAWMKEVQGVADTWFTGSTFSHEAVSAITLFNQRLVKRMLQTKDLSPRRVIAARAPQAASPSGLGSGTPARENASA